MPFDSLLPEEIVKNTIDGKFNLDDDCWENVSDEAKDLINNLLKTNPKERISLEDAISHPWQKKFDMKIKKIK